MPRRLILIRHSISDVRPDVPAAEWHLSPTGLASARAFSTRVDPGTASTIFSSFEPKALQTAQALSERWSLPVQQIAGLHEHERPEPTLFSKEEFACRVREMFERPHERVFGSESAEDARRRFTRTILQLVQRTQEDIVVVTHGTVISLFLAACTGKDAFAVWQRLRMPCALTLTVPELTLERLTLPDEGGASTSVR